MATQIQLRRGTATQNNAFTGAVGEVTADTTNNKLRLHDGSTAGGHAIGGGTFADIAGGGTFTGNVTLEDSTFLIFGNSTDFYIEHNGGVSRNLVGSQQDMQVNLSTGKDLAVRVNNNERFMVDNSGVHVPDNIEYYIGSGDDAYLVHDGSNTNFVNNNGELKFIQQGNGGLWINTSASTNSSIYLESLGSLKAKAGQNSFDLYYSGNKKFETTNTGVTVTGGIIAGGLTYPTSDGSSGQFLKTDGSGNLTFDDAGGSGGLIQPPTALNSYATIAGGNGNTASTSYSFVGGGQTNEAKTNSYAAVVGGLSNDATGTYSFVGGGQTNKASGDRSTVGGGINNDATNDMAVIGGGNGNDATGSESAICGGSYNDATGSQSFVGGGGGNKATTTYAVVCGGDHNEAKTNPYAAVVGGQNNDATGIQSFVGGGLGNTASGGRSTISGGQSNTVSADYTTISGGINNTASSNSAFIGGGGSNDATAQFSTVAGGSTNKATGLYTSVVGGLDNRADADYATVLGGSYGHTRGTIGKTVFAASGSPIGTFHGYSQAGLLIVGATTSDATTTTLRSNQSSASASNQCVLENGGSLFAFTVTVVGREIATGHYACIKFEGVIDKQGSLDNVTIRTTPTKTTLGTNGDGSNWDAEVDADTTNQALRVKVTGEASTFIRWVAKVETTELGL